MIELRDAFGRVNEQVLEDGGGLVFAADSEVDAAGALGGLLTLKTKHKENKQVSAPSASCSQSRCDGNLPERPNVSLDASQRNPSFEKWCEELTGLVPSKAQPFRGW